MHKQKHISKDRAKDTSWDNVAGWYDQYVSELSDHHRDLIIPGALRMLEPKAGQGILDMGCGQGILCRELARIGARVIGIDSSKKLIDIARSKSRGSNIEYHVADAANLSDFADGSFDAVCSILALQNMEPLEKIVNESSRLVKSGGKLLWVLSHPCFRIPRQSGWGYDEKRKLQYRRIDRYMSPLKVPIKMHPGAAPNVITWTFHRPLSEYFGRLNASGFAVLKLEEWISNRVSRPGIHAKAENAAREEFPLFLAILAIKQ